VSPKLPRVTGDDVLRALKRAGWYEIRQTGSHVHLNHADRPGVLVTVPVHAGQVLPVGTLAAILSRAGLSGDELRRLL
jgi:predicted RNA binding protein YcfA (HicA-like mRNA interferase family)